MFLKLSPFLFPVLRNGAWEIVHWEKVCIDFYFVKGEDMHRGVL